MITSSHARSKQWTGRHVLIVMISFFSVIITVNITMAVLASSTWTGLRVKNSYVASQDFNALSRAADRQRAAGWRSNVQYEGGQLLINVTDAERTPAPASTLTLHYGRPVADKFDRTITLSATADGAFLGDLNLPSGQWELEIEATMDGNPYRRRIRLWVSRDGTGQIQ